MNNNIYVKLISDTNFIPIKYLLLEANVSSSATETNCLLVCVENGFDTEENHERWVKYRDTKGIVGVVGSFLITTLNNIIIYTPHTPS